MLSLLKHFVDCKSVILLTVLWCNNINPLFGQCSDPQYDALVEIYLSTDGDNWRRSDGWNEDCNICNWYGVTCDPSGNIIELHLNNNRLSGNLPSSIGEFDNLISLDISNNRFNSALPSAIGELQSLEYLDIRNSRFNGSLPDAIGNLATLKSLNLSGNQFSGSLPLSLGNLNSLEILNIFSTSLGGELPNSLGNLSALKEFRIGVNNFSGSIPSSFGNLSQLEILEITLENISGTIPESIGNMVDLQYLYIQYTDIEGEIPSSIGNLTSLKELYLNSNLISGTIPTSLGNLTNLYELYLTYNYLEGPLPESFGSLGSLVRFYGYNNHFTGPLPASIGNLSNLKILDLGYNEISGGIPSNMGQLTALEILFLNNNQLNREIPWQLSKLVNLRNVDISNNFLSGCFANELTNLCTIPYIITEPNCFYKPLSSFCSGDGCISLLEVPGMVESICSGESITISGVGDQFDYSWSTGEESSQITVNPLENTEYTVTATNNYGCVFDESVEITLFPTTSIDLEQNICEGEILAIGDHSFDTEGFYIIYLTDNNGCDSIINLNLSILPQHHLTIQEAICSGDSLLVNDVAYQDEGIYNIILTNEFGCDSTIVLDLSVIDKEIIEIVDTICAGHNYEVLGHKFREAGYYQFEADNGGECLSTVRLDLTVNISDRIQIDTTICYGSSVYFFETSLSEEGSYSIPYVNAMGCDSIVTLNIYVEDIIETDLQTSICQGQYYDFNGQQLFSEGYYESVFSTEEGCDSLVKLTLDILSLDTIYLDTTLCYGQTLTFHDELYSQPGLYTKEIYADGSCNTIAIISVESQDRVINEINASICKGNTYDFNGTSLNDPGIYEGVFYSQGGCDSTVLLTLEIIPSDTLVVDTILCKGEMLIINGIEYDLPGTYLQYILEKDQCEKVMFINFEYFKNELEYIEIAICEGEQYEIGGLTFEEEGNYTITIQDSNGCDSVIDLSLSVLPGFDTSFIATICPGEAYNFSGNSYSAPGIYNHTFTSVSGCDSTITFELKEISEETDTVHVSICEGESYFIGELEFVLSGQYTVTDNSANCIKEIELILDVTPIPVKEVKLDICEGSKVEIHGNQFENPGIYEFTFPSTSLCDTIVLLELNTLVPNQAEITGNQPSCVGETITLEISGFESYEWNDNSIGSTLNVMNNGIYSVTATDLNGCKSSSEVEIAFIPNPNAWVVSQSMPTECNPLGGTIILDSKTSDALFSIDGGNTWVNSPIFSGLPENNYTISIADKDTVCLSELSTIIDLEEQVSILISNTEIRDNNSCNNPSGGISIYAVSQEGNLQYSIDGGSNWQDSNDFNGMGGGEYQVVVRTDDMECVKALEDPIYINDVTNIEYEVVVTQELVCPGESDARAYINTGTYTGGLNFLWPDGQTGAEAWDLPSGNHTVKMESNDGCVQFIAVEILDPPKLTYPHHFPADTSICVGEFLEVKNPSQEYDYTWYGPSGYIADSESIVINEEGMYYVQVSDYRGCMISDTVNIELYKEDFSGIDFLLSSEGLMGVPTAIVDVSWPVAENVSWVYNDTSVVMLDSTLNQLIVEFKDTGNYEISMMVEIGKCDMMITKNITIYNDSSQLVSQYGFEAFNDFIQDINVFPNPNFGDFSLRTSLSKEANILVTIVNPSGRIVLQQTFNDQNLYTETIDITNEPPGVYALIVQTEQDVRYLTFSKN